VSLVCPGADPDANSRRHTACCTPCREQGQCPAHVQQGTAHVQHRFQRAVGDCTDIRVRLCQLPRPTEAARRWCAACTSCRQSDAARKKGCVEGPADRRVWHAGGVATASAGRQQAICEAQCSLCTLGVTASIVCGCFTCCEVRESGHMV